jgi:hypothetical protein
MSSMERWAQTTFRYRDDDGSETAATWRQLNGVDDTLDLDTTYRMRFLITGNHTNGPVSFNISTGFQYNVDLAGWVDITTTSANVKAVESANTSWTISDEDILTTQMAGAADYANGYMDTTGATSDISVLDTEEAEFEIVFQLLSSELSGGESVQMRIVDAGSALTTYSATPDITVASAGGTAVAVLGHHQLHNTGM